MKTLEERANWEAMKIISELQMIPPAESYKFLVDKVLAIQRDAREGMVPFSDVKPLLSLHIARPTAILEFRSKHPNLFTK